MLPEDTPAVPWYESLVSIWWECVASCASDNVVSPTVPETPGHHPQPLVCWGSDADHILPGIVRRQAVGSLRTGTGQAVGVGLRTTGLSCLLARTVGVVYSAYISIGAAALQSRSVKVMCVASRLLHAQRRGADSAGNTRPPPSTPRLPPLRRGSHNARRSTAAGCWPPRS